MPCSTTAFFALPSPSKRAVRQGAPADRQISIRDDLSMPLGFSGKARFAM
jgi:hypothetical protein